MPAKSKAQQRFMGAELARKRAGKATETGMSEMQLEEFASTKQRGLPEKAAKQPKPKMRRGRHGKKTKHLTTSVNKRKF